MDALDAKSELIDLATAVLVFDLAYSAVPKWSAPQYKAMVAKARAALIKCAPEDPVIEDV